MNTLYDRINSILGRECPALGSVSAEGISVIRELEERLERAHQIAQDLDEVINGLLGKGEFEQEFFELLTLTDSVDQLPPRDSGE